MTKQEKFEQAYAEAHGMPVETFQAYRMGDTYRLPMIAKCWRFWNMAIDSVVVELPEGWGGRSSKTGELAPHSLLNSGQVREAIEAAGLRVVS